MSEKISWVCRSCQYSHAVCVDKPFKFCPECGCQQQLDETTASLALEGLGTRLALELHVDSVETGADKTVLEEAETSDLGSHCIDAAIPGKSTGSKNACKTKSGVNTGDLTTESIVARNEHWSEQTPSVSSCLDSTKQIVEGVKIPATEIKLVIPTSSRPDTLSESIECENVVNTKDESFHCRADQESGSQMIEPDSMLRTSHDAIKPAHEHDDVIVESKTIDAKGWGNIAEESIQVSALPEHQAATDVLDKLAKVTSEEMVCRKLNFVVS